MIKGIERVRRVEAFCLPHNFLVHIETGCIKNHGKLLNNLQTYFTINAHDEVFFNNQTIPGSGFKVAYSNHMFLY